MKNALPDHDKAIIEVEVYRNKRVAEIKVIMPRFAGGDKSQTLESQTVKVDYGIVVDYDELFREIESKACLYNSKKVLLNAPYDEGLVLGLKENGFEVKIIKPNKRDESTGNNPDRLEGELKELNECKIERVEINDGDTLVVQCPSMISNEAYSRITKEINGHFEKKGLKNVTALFLEEGVELKAILTPPKFNKVF